MQDHQKFHWLGENKACFLSK